MRVLIKGRLGAGKSTLAKWIQSGLKEDTGEEIQIFECHQEIPSRTVIPEGAIIVVQNGSVHLECGTHFDWIYTATKASHKE